MTKRLFLALGAAAATSVLGASVWGHRSASDVSEMLKHAGYKPDGSGRFEFPDRSLGGITPAYDPNLKDPTTGFRSCFNRINVCLLHSSSLDDCVSSAPKCVSATPWKNDPGGDDCCPDSGIGYYFDDRKTETADVALMKVMRSMCYPGLESFLNGKGGGTP